MVFKTAFPLLALLAIVASAAPAWADGERGTRAEADVYAARESDAPTLQEFSGGLLGGVLAAIVAFVSDAFQAIIDLFCGDDECETWPPGDQGRAPDAVLPAPA
jgi:hypothetical protein